MSARLLLPPVRSEGDTQLEASEKSCSVLLQALSHLGDMLGPFGRLEPPSAKETRSHSPACNTHEVKVPSPLRFLTRPVQPEVTRPSGHSMSGSCGNPLGEGGLNPRGGTGLGSKPSATEPNSDPLGEGGQNPKGETDWHGGTSRRSDSALRPSAHNPGNESGSAGSTAGACSALLHVQSLTGDMHGPLGRLEPPAAKDT